MAASIYTARIILAQNLRRIRRERGMTQETLSHESGVMQSHVSEIEAGKRNASVDLVGALALALAVPVAALFEEPVESVRDVGAGLRVAGGYARTMGWKRGVAWP